MTDKTASEPKVLHEFTNHRVTRRFDGDHSLLERQEEGHWRYIPWTRETASEIARLAAQVQQQAALAPLCEEHGRPGGARSGCPYCALVEQSRVLSEIDYACGPPNEMQVSAYDVHCNEQAVLDAVKRKLAEQADELFKIKLRLAAADEFIEVRCKPQAAEIERLTQERDDARRALVLMDFPPIKGPDGDFVYQQVAAAREAMAKEEKR